jgi:hypothetical protein
MKKDSFIVIRECDDRGIDFDDIRIVKKEPGVEEAIHECDCLIALLSNNKFRVKGYDEMWNHGIYSKPTFYEKYLTSKGFTVYKPKAGYLYKYTLEEAKKWAKKKMIRIRKWKFAETIKDPF